MPIPDFQSIMLPFLETLGDGRESSFSEVSAKLAAFFRLSDEEQSRLLPSGKHEMFLNRVGWTRTYLKKAGLIEAPRRGVFTITARGRAVLDEKPARIDVKFLKRFPEFQAFQSPVARAETSLVADTESPEIDMPPDEQMERGYELLRRKLADDLLVKIATASPGYFETIVVDLLVKMGYGGDRAGAALVTGKSGDQGIDGVINEDRLGLDVVYVQAKRWSAVVGRPEIQKFVGALQGQRARKGVFITTSTFSRDALDYVSRIDQKVVLVDGEALVSHMIDHGIGITQIKNYTLWRIDSDYFEEEE